MNADKSSEKGPEITLPSGANYDIPVGGSLGLLALGYRGVMLWRGKRKEAYNSKIAIENSNQV